MSLDRLIAAANAYKKRVPHAAAKSLKVSLDGAEAVEVGSVTVENDADGATLVLTSKQDSAPEGAPGEEAAQPQRQARPKGRKVSDAVPQQDRPEVRPAEGGPVDED